MLKLKKIAELRAQIETYKKESLTVGFVPTMGFLHNGHLSLIKECKKKCDVCVVSIFVNPSQFNDLSDFEAYPKNEKRDFELLEKSGCDLVWVPDIEDIESLALDLNYDVEGIDQGLEGVFRAGHFKGVKEVVYRLFRAVVPDFSFFGEKDYQQFRVVEKMATNNNLTVKVLACPTMREEDGLAMSSRNVRLSPVDREIAPLLHAEMKVFSQAFGSSDTKVLLQKSISNLEKRGFEVEYLSVHSFGKEDRRLFAAAVLGGVRLIDNIAV